MAKKQNFREEARSALIRAKAELSSGDDNRLRYAALEIRMAMEALVYGRAEAYGEDFPEAEYAEWQPRKVLAALIELDPHADQTRGLRMSKEPSDSPNPTEWVDLGTEHVLSLTEVKKHYDALGSWLHTQTPAQRRSPKATDLNRLRRRCEVALLAIETVVESRLWNVVFRNHANFECDRCRKPIRAFRAIGSGRTTTNCRHCGAGYVLDHDKDRKLYWTAEQSKVTCPNPNCDETTFLWKDQIVPGAEYQCLGCGEQLKVTLAIAFKAKTSTES